MISAVWLVRSHQIASDLRYWLTYIGYDKRDHSLSHKIYLGYATAFFSVWGFATLALLASFAGGVLAAVAASLSAGATGRSSVPLEQAAAGLLALALLIWWLYRGYKAGRSSPMTFTEDDAALICQTPVSRPAVALLWMLGDWMRQGPAFWALSVTLAFALQDAALGPAVSVEHTPRYVLAGLRVLSVVVPVQWGLMALAWAWGVLRLERDRVRRWWWLGPVGLAVGLVLLLASSGAGLLGGFFHGTAGIVLAPLIFPAGAGYGLGGAAAWLPGLLAGLGWGLVGSLALGLAARPLNLGRAAQESTGRSASETAAQAGNAQAAAEIALRQRLGTGHPPTRLGARPGRQALAWKAALSWGRQGGWRLAGPLLVIFVAAAGMVLAPDWGVRAWALLAWMVAVEQFAAGPLVSDLRMWSLFRGLPVETRGVLLAEMALPWALVLLVGLLALGLSVVLGPALMSALAGVLGAPAAGLPAWAGLLLPGAALSCGLAAAVDILRSARSSRLLTGQAPMPGTTGVIIAALCCGLAALAVQFGGGGLFGYLLGALVTGGASWLLLEIGTEVMLGVE
jgi:hypothetical protein